MRIFKASVTTGEDPKPFVEVVLRPLLAATIGFKWVILFIPSPALPTPVAGSFLPSAPPPPRPDLPPRRPSPVCPPASDRQTLVSFRRWNRVISLSDSLSFALPAFAVPRPALLALSRSLSPVSTLPLPTDRRRLAVSSLVSVAILSSHPSNAGSNPEGSVEDDLENGTQTSGRIPPAQQRLPEGETNL